MSRPVLKDPKLVLAGRQVEVLRELIYDLCAKDERQEHTSKLFNFNYFLAQFRRLGGQYSDRWVKRSLKEKGWKVSDGRIMAE